MKKILAFLLIALFVYGLSTIVSTRNGGTGKSFADTSALKAWIAQSAGGGSAVVYDSVIGDTGTIPAPASSALQITLLRPTGTANYTLAPPAHGMNGYRLFFFAGAADTINVTCSNGFNGKGSSGTLSSYGFYGDGVILTAWDDFWIVTPKNMIAQ